MNNDSMKIKLLRFLILTILNQSFFQNILPFYKTFLFVRIVM